MDDLQKMLLREKQQKVEEQKQKDKMAEVAMMKQLQSAYKQFATEDKEKQIEEAMDIATQNPDWTRMGQKGLAMQQMLKEEREGTPEQKARFARLREKVLKTRYPGTF